MATRTPKTNPDAVLIKAIVRAYHRFEVLKNRTAQLITDIAKAEQLPRTYVSSIVPFALLSPDITVAMLERSQPTNLNLDKVINFSLPLDWAEQRTVLGFASAWHSGRPLFALRT